MSREELADLVNQLDDGSDPDGPVTANHVGKLERGVNTWPRAPRRAAYRAALQVATDAEIGFVNRRRRPTDCPVLERPAWSIPTGKTGQHLVDLGPVMSRRDTLLATITSVAAAAGLLGRPETQRRVGTADVARVRAVTALFRSVEYEWGGGVLYRQIADFAETVTGLVSCAGSTVQPGLLVAVGEARQLAGWAAFDTGRHSDAQRHWLSAERACVAAGDLRLAARVRYCQARQFQHLRHNRDAVETLRLARDHLGSQTTPAITAMIDGAEAASLAALGQHDEALKRLASASDAFDRTTPDGEPDWMRFYDRGEVLAQHGRVFRDMARHDRRHGRAAVDWVTQAIDAFKTENVRSTVLNEVGLCSALLLAGEPEQAVSIGRQAMLDAQQLTSARIADRVRNLARDLAPYRDLPATRDFTRAITAISTT
jgi:hypothetical protein